MDSLIKQMRLRFSGGQENTEESYSFKERRISPQRTQSFKAEKKRAQNWFRRKFSRTMSHDYDCKYQMEHVTAVAAAAYAIKSLEDSRMADQKKTGEAPESFMTRLRSKKEDITTQLPEPGRVSKRFSGSDSRVPVTDATDEKKTEKAPTIKKSLTFADEHLDIPDATKSKRAPGVAPSIKKTPTFADEKGNSTPERVTVRAPSLKKTRTFSDELLNSTNGKKPEVAVPETETAPPIKLRNAPSKSDVPPTIRSPPPPPLTETRRQRSTRHGTNEKQADAWERAELEKIKHRYEKLDETISTWETKKKRKARSKLDKTESELERRRTRALQKFRSDMETIEQIAGGARAQADEKRRNEELKVKEKANMIRTTGKVPATCFCF